MTCFCLLLFLRTFGGIGIFAEQIVAHAPKEKLFLDFLGIQGPE
jgi:hypothetical protein